MIPPIHGKDAALRLARLVATAAALLLAAGSCRLSPLAPTRGADESVAIGIGDAAPAGGRPEAPPIGAIDITREDDLVHFSIGIVPDGRPGPEAAAHWTFRLYVDADRNLRTGDDAGADVALIAGLDGRIAVWRHESSLWRQTQTAPLVRTPAGITFDLPASALGEESGFVDYVLDVYEIRTSPDGPGRVHVASYAGSNGPGTPERTAVPAITNLRAEVRRGTLYLTGKLKARNRGAGAEYTPYRPGGWCLQVFLNTDRLATGYWLGFDYVARGVEWNPATGACIVRRITLDPDSPGGWGPESGKATLRASHGTLAIAIPLGAIGGNGGNVDFVLETYATVACPDCGSGYSHVFAADYFGSSSAGPGALPDLASGPGTRGATRLSLRSDRLHPDGLRPITADRTPPPLLSTR
jgi:hypothetical protein